MSHNITSNLSTQISRDFQFQKRTNIDLNHTEDHNQNLFDVSMIQHTDKNSESTRYQGDADISGIKEDDASLQDVEDVPPSQVNILDDYLPDFEQSNPFL